MSLCYYDPMSMPMVGCLYIITIAIVIIIFIFILLLLLLLCHYVVIMSIYRKLILSFYVS